MFCKHLPLLITPHPAHTDPPVLFPLVSQITRGPTSDQLFDNKNWKIANQILKGLCVTRPSSWARKIRDGTTCQMSKKKNPTKNTICKKHLHALILRKHEIKMANLPEAKFKKGVKPGG